MLSERSIIASYFRYFEAYSYKQAKKIGLMSEKNLEIFKQRHLQYPCEVLRNWASTQTVVGNHENYVSIRERLNLKNKVIYFYGGNIGHAQDMANLMRLAKRMQCYPDAHFLFIGQGDEVELINTLAVQWKLTNYSYLPSVGQSEFKLILTDVDVGLFSLSARHTAHNFPGKLLGYMVEALPILGSVNYGNDLQCIVNGNNAGYIHVNGEDDNLFSSAEMLYANEMLRREIGSNAKKLLVEQFSVSSAACQITKVLEE
ncbi:Cap5L family capsular polysaccharide synthesis enzyme [Obesumbacterium proteus ATCC 12841]|uniref:Cap5L family capsular polysaccharide synthesis enzyme n=1 Tax=Obesumbacterium proteus ATCC 12841 TaxID=1354268 RepID=A0AA91EF19_9GAMM|nr:Cap5L family capsular polysaccharide synthesis enzyme [Obesumbacterium proteus ATCC 12841]